MVYSLIYSLTPPMPMLLLNDVTNQIMFPSHKQFNVQFSFFISSYGFVYGFMNECKNCIFLFIIPVVDSHLLIMKHHRKYIYSLCKNIALQKLLWQLTTKKPVFDDWKLGGKRLVENKKLSHFLLCFDFWQLKQIESRQGKSFLEIFQFYVAWRILKICKYLTYFT